MDKIQGHGATELFNHIIIQAMIQERREKLGKFILKTNDLELTPDQLLKY